MYYRLIGKLAVPCSDIEEVAAWYTNDAWRIVRQDMVGPLRVSTVFLIVDHAYFDGPDVEPLLFETMIFDDCEDRYQTRCTTWDQAELMHEVAMTEAKYRWERAQALLAVPNVPKVD